MTPILAVPEPLLDTPGKHYPHFTDGNQQHRERDKGLGQGHLGSPWQSQGSGPRCAESEPGAPSVRPSCAMVVLRSLDLTLLLCGYHSE